MCRQCEAKRTPWIPLVEELFNDQYTSYNYSFYHVNASTATFHQFPLLPTEIRLKIWRACFPPARVITVDFEDTTREYLKLFDEEEHTALSERLLYRLWERPYTERNELGNLVSGCPYDFRVMGVPYEWSRCLQRVNTEARDAYRLQYRLALPFPLRPEPGEMRNVGGTESEMEAEVYTRMKSRIVRDGGQGSVLRLDPESDIFMLDKRSLTFSPHSSHGDEELDRVILELYLAILHDAWAYDPRGVGIARLAKGSSWRFLARRGSRHDFDGIDRMLAGASSTLKLAASNEAKANLVQYFAGFANTKTHAFYHCVHPWFQEVRYGQGFDNLDSNIEPEYEGEHWQLMHGFPTSPFGTHKGRQTVALSAVAAVLEQDPRPLERDTCSPRFFASDINSAEHDDTIRTVFHWRRLLHRIGGLSCDQAVASVQVLVWGNGSNRLMPYPERQQVSLRQFVVHQIHIYDRGQMSSKIRTGRDVEYAPKDGGPLFLLPNDTGVHELAGMWVFRPDGVSLGRHLQHLPADDQEDGRHGLRSAYDTPYIQFDVRADRPGLIVFDLESLPSWQGRGPADKLAPEVPDWTKV